jgi:hypothetical protein
MLLQLLMSLTLFKLSSETELLLEKEETLFGMLCLSYFGDGESRAKWEESLVSGF